MSEQTQTARCARRVPRFSHLPHHPASVVTASLTRGPTSMAPVYGAGRSVAQRRGAAVRVLADAPSMARAVFVLTAICCLQPASPHGSAASDECTGDNRAPLPRSWAPWCSFIICGREEDRPVDPCGCERKCDIPFAGQVRRRQVAPPVTLAHQISEAAQSGDFIRAGALQKAMEADRAGRQRGARRGRWDWCMCTSCPKV